ncbi:Protein-arginine deiminase type-3 [Metarhizium anisopliae]|nr:Protein-arginine deiminase type-3 [Metarhizium anisopliae]
MHLVFLIAALPFTGAIPQRPPNGFAAPIDNFKVTILADSNRDGKVDITGDTDLAGKETWTEESGAIFLANIIDTDRRCSSQITGACASELPDMFFSALPEKPELDPKLAESQPPLGPEWQPWYDGLSDSNKAAYDAWRTKMGEYGLARDVDRGISQCNDSSDNVLRNPTYLAPLRTVPNPLLSDSATGSIVVANETAALNVRLFYKTGGQWNFIDSNYTFKSQDLKAGLEFGIDARDVRRPGPGGWDGRAVVELRVKDGEKVATDLVMLRVAPVLTQHHGQTAKQLLTATGYGGNAQDRFIEQLKEMSSKAGLRTPLHVFDTAECYGQQEDDKWAQDFFEPGYMSIPGPNGPVSIHIMIRSGQAVRSSGRKIFQDLRSNTVGAVQYLVIGDTLDSLGNLETVPPYTHNSKSYPAGRAVMGSADGKKPGIREFLEAQETQAPMELDTSWLAVQHTDEFIQFLPVDSERGWVMMVADPRSGLEILQKAAKDGHGKQMAVSRPKSPADESKWHVTNTIDGVLNIANFTGFQEDCANNIDKNVDILKQETGITDAEIIRVPSLYQAFPGKNWQYSESSASTNGEDQQLENEIPKSGGEKQRRQMSDGRAVALYPAAINSVVLGNRQILAPNPWGPKIDGHDVLAAAVKAAYDRANYTIYLIDDWFTHHGGVGDVHCGSNVIRELMGVKWW